jgi:hypothetical protein
MQALDDAMIGTVAQPGHPSVTDTGHISLAVRDRAGDEETCAYRGPLVPHPLTRDELGPYHSADQARRVAPEVGLEDISYAAAFEVGRLIAMADARLAQELLRWRNGAYLRALVSNLIGALPSGLLTGVPVNLLDQLDRALLPALATGVLGQVHGGAGPAGDPWELGAIAGAIGMQPDALAAAWGLSSTDAAAMLGVSDTAAVASQVGSIERTGRNATSLGDVASRLGDLQRLEGMRAELLNQALRASGETP